jgi:hypothetical protein
MLAAGDELLAAVQDIMVAVAQGRRAQGGGVAARVRLGQGECTQQRAAGQRAQPAFLLGVVRIG